MNVLLGVSGGIAAYKAIELVSLLMKADHRVRVIMTPGAQRFVTPLTFEAMSGHPVMTDTFTGSGGSEDPGAIEHINWAKWADVAIIAPATASTLAKLACGLADDALSTVWMALPPNIPCLIAPAMNTQMWDHPVVQRNLRWIDELGRYEVIPPVSKRLACGDIGVGGLADVQTLFEAIDASLRDR